MKRLALFALLCLVSCSTTPRRSGEVLVHALEKKDPKLLNESCAFAGGAACRELGRLRRAVGDPVGAVEYFEKACTLGNPHACRELAELELRAGRRSRVQTLLKSSCESGDQEGCYLWAKALLPEAERGPALQALQRNCSSWHGESCFLLGQVSERGGDRKKASAFYESACEKDVPGACTEFARLEAAAGKAQTRPQAIAGLLAVDCRNGLPRACGFVDFLERRERDPELGDRSCEECKTDNVPEACHLSGWNERVTGGNPAKSRAYFEAACRKGHAFACWEVASEAYAEDDLGKYVKFARSACVKGAFYGCYHLGAHPELLERSAEGDSLLEKACKAGEGWGCIELGERAASAGRDSRALELFGRACELSRNQGCLRKGQLLELSRRREEAERTYDQGCEREHPASCYAFAMARKDGLDRGEVRALLKRSCEGKSALACYWLSRISMEWRQEPPEDPAVMRAAYREFCSNGVVPACLSLAELLAAGPRPHEAQEPLERACARGSIEACLRGGLNREACDLGSADGCKMLK
ncbi:MAG: hypothetical protein NDJ90_08075 [Oligoflexia bacterium]|nr:hypothetical protein [Oligoflexia bacterium]